MGICLTKEKIEEAFLQYMNEIFALPEVVSARVKDIIITRENRKEAGRQAFEAGFHDIYSDTDLHVNVRLPKNGFVTKEDYIKRIDRFGVSEDTALGRMFVPENNVQRIIFKNGMRYDLIFDFEDGDNTELQFEQVKADSENDKWPMENINRFWFIQIQALGKLYRKDYLIGDHLANTNLNETLVMQMIMRDIKYASNHHRYGYSEELEYTKDLEKCPYKTEDETFNGIADHLYAAALAYDRLVKYFYPDYTDRCAYFLAIWEAYEAYRIENKYPDTNSPWK
ncbi:MAG: hypothetical protein J5840_06780 [Lachnospiraceae bacterium]|nr:hypothetical protein [Lachnospiraceae bacterium]